MKRAWLALGCALVLALGCSDDGDETVGDAGVDGDSAPFRDDLGQTLPDLGPRPDVSQEPTVATLAGTTLGNEDGIYLMASFNNPHGIVVDPQGVIYVADTDNHKIRRLENGMVSTFVGTGMAGDVDGPAEQAQLDEPHDLALDENGVLYISERGGDRIRKVENGQVSVFVGTGEMGYKDGAALEAQLWAPAGIFYKAGVLYFCDRGNHLIRKVEGGQVSTIAGVLYESGIQPGKDGPAEEAQFRNPNELVVDDSGAIFVADGLGHAIRRIANGEVTTIAGELATQGYEDGTPGRLYLPVGLALDGDTLIIGEYGGKRIRTLDTTTGLGTLVGTGEAGKVNGHFDYVTFLGPQHVAVHGNKIYVVDAATGSDNETYLIRVINR